MIWAEHLCPHLKREKKKRGTACIDVLVHAKVGQ